ncbi:LysR family transcriptional regulator [Brochothrix thermosphacta]|uniref:LysR family transcriptional regulator n=1 Tax=Brochothrix thermosphacta TaxID=2756 RepID=UPI0034E49760
MLTLLHTFITVYEKQSFSKAASLLFISQPTVSTHINRLETLIETPLFIRYNKNRIEPTEFGTFFTMRIPSRNHCKAEPATKILPSSA